MRYIVCDICGYKEKIPLGGHTAFERIAFKDVCYDCTKTITEIVKENVGEMDIPKIICPLKGCTYNSLGYCKNNFTVKLKISEDDKLGEMLDCDNFKWKEESDE